MEAPLKVTVALDNTSTDKFILNFVLKLSQVLQIDQLNFVHVVEDKSEKKAEIAALVQQHISSALIQSSNVHILEGVVLASLMKFLQKNNQDILVLGKKNGKLENKMINKSPVSTIVIPEHHFEQINNIVVPIDFSRGSSLALKTALSIRKNTSTKIILVNIYSVLSGYTKTGKSYEEAAKNMKKAAEDDAVEYLKQYQIDPKDVECHFVLDDDERPADKIYKFAKEVKCNLLLIGSKGRTDAASILLGSIAEKVLQFDTDIPLWVVKSKGETLGFFEALFKI